MNVINLGATHKKASISTLEALSFRDPEEAVREILSLNNVAECALLQTCNRVELYVIPTKDTELNSVAEETRKYWQRRCPATQEEFVDVIEENYQQDAMEHLMRLASGLESMIVGEDQILGQVKEAFELAQRYDAVGPSLTQLFKAAIRTGGRVRELTNINDGTLSLGSAAVSLAEEILGSLHGKKILLIGAGLIGAVAGKALVHRKLEGTEIYVVNRDYEKGMTLARTVNGHACTYDRLPELLPIVDTAIVMSAAPHFVITKTAIKEALEKRNGSKLLIIDLAQPRNVEKSIADFPQVDLRNIDSLRTIADFNIKMHRAEIKRAESIVNESVRRFQSAGSREHVEPLVSSIFRKAESVRKKELKKAIRMLGDLDDEKKEILENLSRILIKRALQQPVTNIRKVAERGDAEAIAVATKLFKNSKTA